VVVAHCLIYLQRPHSATARDIFLAAAGRRLRDVLRKVIDMNEHAKRIRKPRCFLVYALAPVGLPAAEANRIFNNFIGDKSLPLPIFHDHFIGQPGGVAIFYVDTIDARDALLIQKHLAGWQVEYQPMIFSYSPSAFDEQTAFTLNAYRGTDWETLQKDKRPSYGNPRHESESAEEE